MHWKLKGELLTATAFSMVFAAPAWAQDSAEGASGSGNDIVVTARRVEERLQDVPISITVFSQEKLDNNNISSAKDLATYTPGLTTQNRNGSDAAVFTIRGFTQEQRTTATVGTYFADVVMPRGSGASQGGDSAGPGQLFDLQNVQVLKGPQGTLFGRNSTGGAVLLVPRKPTDNLEGYIEGSAGDYDMWRVQAVANIPVNDTMRLRFGVDRQKRDGYLKNAGRLGFGPFGDAGGSVDYWAARASLVADLTPDLENYTIVSYLHSQNTGIIPKITKCYPGLNVSGIPVGDGSCAQMQREARLGFWSVSNSLPDSQSLTESWQVINTTTWRASDTLTVKNIAAYAEYRNRQNLDLFGNYIVVPSTLQPGTETSPANVVGFAYTHSEATSGYTQAQSSFVEELQFQGRSDDGRFTWQAGLYFEESSPLGYAGVQTSNFTPCADIAQFDCRPFTPSQSIGQGAFSIAETKFQGMAAYAQASYDITDQLKVTGGIRYTRDEMSTDLINATISFRGSTAATRLRCANLTAPGYVNPATFPFTLDQRFNICKQHLSTTSEKPTWLLGLDFKPMNDVLVYAKWARGYRQGGITVFGADPLQIYEPETVDTYELGAKMSWRGAVPGNFNISGFYNDFRDQQIQIGVSCVNSTAPGLLPFRGDCGATTAIVNAGKSRLYGFEAEASISPFEGLKLEAAYAYLNTKLQEFVLPALPAEAIYNQISRPIVGDPIPNAMPHKFTGAVTYTLPLPDSVGTVSIGGTFVYQSAYRVVADSVRGSGNGVLPGSHLINLNLNWGNVAGLPLDASVFVTNVTNEKVYLHANDNQVRGFLSNLIGEPRMWGVRLRYKFGE